jgi:hypothetical protein
MKPDWQNKSFAKGGAATGPSTMHSKLKVGMSSLHSKIGAATNNMPQAPKPAVRKFADGGVVRTRSDDEIGDTDPRTGKVDPGSYDRRMAEGAKNMERLSSAADTLKSFFSSKEAPASASNITGDSGMSASDTAKKQAMSGGAQMPAAAEEPRRQISDYMVKKEATEDKTEPVATPVEAEPAKKVVKSNKPSVSNVSSTSSKKQPEVKMTGSPDMPSSKANVSVAQKETAAQMREKQLRASGGSRGARMNEVTKSGTPDLPVSKTKFVPGFGEVDDRGMITNTRGGKTIEQRLQDVGASTNKSMNDAAVRYLNSKMSRGETLTKMEKAQADRLGIIY